MAALPDTLAVLADTSLLPGDTVRASPEATALRGPSPFSTGRRTLPALAVRLPGAPAGNDDAGLDLTIKEILAEGGMGRIYVAEQRTLAREVAIKTVKDPRDRALADALIWEGAITGHLDHPGVTPVHLLGQGPDGAPLLVMKRIAGVKWTDLLAMPDPSARIPTLPRDRERAHIEILMEVARTLHHAHKKGIVHLDIKPDNVMIGDLGEVYVVDWGIATTLERVKKGERAVAGTPAFMAPEMAAGDEVGPWTDVYLLGATLHGILTGEPRHAGTDLHEVLSQALVSAPVAYGAEVPEALGALANAATSVDRAVRPPDALAFRAALAEHLSHAASLALCRDGTSRLSELDALPDVEAGGARAMRLVTEARFAFQAAIEGWKDNAEAIRGLRRALGAALVIEVRRENLAGAREVAAELGEVPAPLAEKLRELDERLRSRAESEAELRRVKDDQDLRRGARARFILFGGVAAVVLVTTLRDGFFLVTPEMGEGVTLFEVIAVPLMMSVVIGAGTAVLRRRANAVGRGVLASFLSSVLLMVVHRAVIFRLGVSAPVMIAGDLLIIAGTMSGTAHFITPRAWLGTGIVVASALLIHVWPASCVIALNVAGVLSILALAWAVRGRTARA